MSILPEKVPLARVKLLLQSFRTRWLKEVIMLCFQNYVLKAAGHVNYDINAKNGTIAD